MCTHDLCFEQKYEKYHNFFNLKIIIFEAVKNCNILQTRVFVMSKNATAQELSFCKMFFSKKII